MHFRIAICDDEVVICAQIEKMLTEVLENLNIKYEIDVFYSGKSLCNELLKIRYDMIFLDIVLPDTSGVEIGEFIRDELKNEITQIIFVSSNENYALKLFDFRPLNFLVKPITYQKLEKVVDKYIVVTEQDNKTFEYNKKYEIYKVLMSDIKYLESHGRKIKIITTDGSDDFYGSIESSYRVLEKHKFLYIHKSIIVNYSFIKQFRSSEVVLSDGTILPISQSKRKEIRERFLKLRKEENI